MEDIFTVFWKKKNRIKKLIEILEYYKEHGPFTKEEICNEMCIGDSTFYSYLKDLKEKYSEKIGLTIEICERKRGKAKYCVKNYEKFVLICIIHILKDRLSKNRNIVSKEEIKEEIESRYARIFPEDTLDRLLKDIFSLSSCSITFHILKETKEKEEKEKEEKQIASADIEYQGRSIFGVKFYFLNNKLDEKSVKIYRHTLSKIPEIRTNEGLKDILKILKTNEKRYIFIIKETIKILKSWGIIKENAVFRVDIEPTFIKINEKLRII